MKRNYIDRTARLLGDEAMEKLQNARVALFGIGGVGSFCAEALVRSGVGHITLIDPDEVAPSNLNRQIWATVATVGKLKVEAAKERLLSINPDLDIEIKPVFFLPENADGFDFSSYDCVLDAVDTVSAKMEIIRRVKDAGIGLISSMGAGNKIDPVGFRPADIYETSVCPLARVMRGLCRKNGVKALRVIYSEEEPKAPRILEKTEGGKVIPASCAFVPSAVGLIAAGEIVRFLIGENPSLYVQ